MPDQHPSRLERVVKSLYLAGQITISQSIVFDAAVRIAATQKREVLERCGTLGWEEIESLMDTKCFAHEIDSCRWCQAFAKDKAGIQ